MFWSKLLQILFISFICIFFSGCNNDEIDSLRAENATLRNEIKKSSEDYFARQQACLEHKDEIENDLKEKEKRSSVGWKYEIEQIFYSPTKHTCFFVSIYEYEDFSITERRLYEYWNHSWYSKNESACKYWYDEMWNKQDNWCENLDNTISALKWK